MITNKPLRSRQVLKIASAALLVFFSVFCVFWAIAFFSMKPPKEKKLIENFQLHRAVYERLRDMLLQDAQVDEVHVGYGVKTTNSPTVREPSEVNFPVSRYNEYVTLLGQIDSIGAFRSEEKQPERICVSAWGAGWAGNTRHVWVCSAARAANQVPSLDGYYRDPKRPRNVFRHIDGDWYLRADW
jgi:hypothetical protein